MGRLRALRDLYLMDNRSVVVLKNTLRIMTMRIKISIKRIGIKTKSPNRSKPSEPSYKNKYAEINAAVKRANRIGRPSPINIAVLSAFFLIFIFPRVLPAGLLKSPISRLSFAFHIFLKARQPLYVHTCLPRKGLSFQNSLWR